jgi:hypothetical protein
MPGGFAHVLDDHWVAPHPTGDQKQCDSVIRMKGLGALQTREVTQLLSRPNGVMGGLYLGVAQRLKPEAPDSWRSTSLPMRPGMNPKPR